MKNLFKSIFVLGLVLISMGYNEAKAQCTVEYGTIYYDSYPHHWVGSTYYSTQSYQFQDVWIECDDPSYYLGYDAQDNQCGSYLIEYIEINNATYTDAVMADNSPQELWLWSSSYYKIENSVRTDYPAWSYTYAIGYFPVAQCY